MKIVFVLFTFLFLISTISADEVDCSSSNASLKNALPKVLLPDIGLGPNTKTSTQFCFDPKNNRELTSDFRELQYLGIFDENHCTNPEKVPAIHQVKFTSFMIKVLDKSPMDIYSLEGLGGSDKIVFTNSSELNRNDKLMIAGTTIGASLIGTIISRQLYNGDIYADKRKHELAGAAINIAGTGIGYLAIETSGLGNKLNMSKNARKCAITATGGLMLLLAAGGKEFYDSRKPQKHTSDIHDFNATALGGGAGVPFMMACSFNF